MRNIYLDPFGTYTSAFDKGVARQMDVEQNRRAARQTDFNYNYITPLDYSNARMANQLAAFNLPYQERNTVYGDQTARNNLYTSNLGVGAQTANLFGITSPVVNAAAQQYGWTPISDGQGNVHFTDPNGNIVGTVNQAGLQAYLGRDDAQKQAAIQEAVNSQNWERAYKLSVLGIKPQAYQAQVDVANIYANRGQPKYDPYTGEPVGGAIW